MAEQDVPEIGPEPTPDETYCDLGRHDRCDGTYQSGTPCICPCHD